MAGGVGAVEGQVVRPGARVKFGAPGFSWRILAHRREKPTIRAAHTGESLDLRFGKRWLPPADADTGQREYREGAWEFDELCIDDWFHIEQMSARHWWIGIGNTQNGEHADYWHVNVNIRPDGRAEVHVEKQ